MVVVAALLAGATLNTTAFCFSPDTVILRDLEGSRPEGASFNDPGHFVHYYYYFFTHKNNFILGYSYSVLQPLRERLFYT